MRVTDPRAIKALAHPLRLDLLELLAAISPATAAQCGRILGVPQANCSFHLRQLAKYGYVEDAGPGEDRRERQWRVADTQPQISVDSGGDRLLRRQIEHVVIDREFAALRAYTDRERDEDPQWREGLGIVSAVVEVTAAQARELEKKWRALLEPYVARPGAADGSGDPDTSEAEKRYVRYFLAATPLDTAAPPDESASPGGTR